MRNVSQIWIEKKDGKLLGQSRAVFLEAFEALPDGLHKVVFEEQYRGYTPTRYKYYFGHVLETILLTVGKHFEILDGNTFRPVRNTKEVHDSLKMKYNPVIIRTPFGVFAVPGSTTGLTDGEFINKFEEIIISEFSAPPFGCDFMPREEWAEMMKQRKQPQAQQ